jgi:hypothetical protein
VSQQLDAWRRERLAQAAAARTELERRAADDRRRLTEQYERERAAEATPDTA